ncbi:hypothetical protein LMG23992_01481 [Cupriavidus laharis]|uniref:eCIS core domain-containing protein n=2 Tax=Cupriavidus laharis TaxID=151654 RepID=A0ABM8WRV6_9BURK|nr:hypothetical protein LMG23992_01481 [Cupriavidus laharis]
MSCRCLTSPVAQATAALVQRRNAAPAQAPCEQCQAEMAADTGFAVGAPDDAFERDADRVAGQVMRGNPVAAGKPETPAGQNPSRGTPPALQRLPAATPNTAQAPAGIRQVLDTPGIPLDARTRTFFEPRFGRDFSSVRVHADDVADRSASALGAQAYTVGHHVVFARGRFAPADTAGRHLLAHELAHVMQQSQARGAMPALQRKGGKGPGSCGLLSAASATVLGSAAHVQIQKALAGRGITSELEIPRASKTEGLSRRCQPLGAVPGFADVARVSRPIVSVGEIKPYYIAQVAGRLQARHYRRRAEQSRQRLTRTGGCGRRSGPGPDDIGFSHRVGPITPASVFSLLSGAISGTENFNAFSLDKKRDLMAKEVGGGAIGYWCVLNAAGKKEKEEQKKKKPKGKAGAANVGVGVSIGGSSVGGANAGVGISVDSHSAAVGTAGAGIAISSDSAAAGAAGAGVSKDTMGAAAGAAGAGAAKDSEGVAAGAAGAGTASGSTSAGAGVAGAGKSEDSMTAGAGAAGKGEVKDSMAAGAGGTGSGKSEGVVGAGRAGSPNPAVDPAEVSGSGAEKQPPGEGDPEGDAREGTTEGQPGGKAGPGASSSGSGTGQGGTGSGTGQAGGTQGGTGKGGQPGKGSGGGGSADKSADKGGQAAGGDKSAGTGSGTGAGSGPANAQPGAGSGQGGGTASNPLGVSTVIPLGTSEAERERIAAEAAKVALLVQNASEAQKALLRHLAQASPDKRYMVPASDWVQKMMNVTQGLTTEEIEYLKQLDWKPGSLTEEALRERIRKLLAERKPPAEPGSGTGDTPSPDAGQGQGGGGKGQGKGPGSGDAGQAAKAGGSGDKASGTQGGSGSVDRATAPPAGSNRDAAGIFSFVILSGMGPASKFKAGQAEDCKVRISDLKTGKTFELEGVSITFESRTDTPVTIGGVKFVNVKFNVYFTRDFWSAKNSFYGRGGKESLTEYDFGRRKVK